MKRVENKFKVFTYETGVEDFYVDFVMREDRNLYEIWLYRDSALQKHFIIGLRADNLDELVNFVESYLLDNKWYGFYDRYYK